jgi:phage-related protein
MLTWLLSFFTLPAIVSQVLRIIASVFEAMVPMLKFVFEILVAWIKALWVGLVDVLDDFRTIIFVLTLAAGAFLWGNINPIVSYIPFVGKNQCELHIQALKKQYDQCKMSLKQR